MAAKIQWDLSLQIQTFLKFSVGPGNGGSWGGGEVEWKEEVKNVFFFRKCSSFTWDSTVSHSFQRTNARKC